MEAFKLASIKDIAKAADVSVSTVSRVINNSPLISEETKKKVTKIMKDLNYVPNSMAQGLSSQQAFTVTLLVDIEDRKSFDNMFFYEIMHGIETVVYRKNMCLIIANLQTSLNKNDMVNWLVNGKRTQGIILPSSILKPRLVRELKKIKFPFVTIGEPTNIKEPIEWVDINNKQGAQQAVEHLLECGYARIAFIGGNQKETFNRNRLSGYKEALLINGLNYREDYVKEGESTKQSGFNMMNDLLRLPEKPDAVICADNIICVGAMKAIKSADLNIPQDIGVMSFDNFPIADLIEPSLTTIDIDVFELGIQAANILFKLIDNPNARQQQSLISTRIEIRESTSKRL
jgi:DNA-binding LacI/PurR family transcriptional regulator